MYLAGHEQVTSRGYFLVQAKNGRQNMACSSVQERSILPRKRSCQPEPLQASNHTQNEPQLSDGTNSSPARCSSCSSALKDLHAIDKKVVKYSSPFSRAKRAGAKRNCNRGTHHHW